MANPIDRLREAVADDWVDPVDSALVLAESLISVEDADWPKALEFVSDLRRSRPDLPLFLAVTETALDPQATRARLELSNIADRLEDDTWLADLARGLLARDSLGVTSIGPNMLDLLERGLRFGATWQELYTEQKAVAQGLGYLQIPVRSIRADHAETMLVPGVARFGSKVWTTQQHADRITRAALAGAEIIPVLHPEAHLSPLNRRAFRPAAVLVEVDA